MPRVARRAGRARARGLRSRAALGSSYTAREMHSNVQRGCPGARGGRHGPARPRAGASHADGPELTCHMLASCTQCVLAGTATRKRARSSCSTLRFADDASSLSEDASVCAPARARAAASRGVRRPRDAGAAKAQPGWLGGVACRAGAAHTTGVATGESSVRGVPGAERRGDKRAPRLAARHALLAAPGAPCGASPAGNGPARLSPLLDPGMKTRTVSLRADGVCGPARSSPTTSTEPTR